MLNGLPIGLAVDHQTSRAQICLYIYTHIEEIRSIDHLLRLRAHVFLWIIRTVQGIQAGIVEVEFQLLLQVGKKTSKINELMAELRPITN